MRRRGFLKGVSLLGAGVLTPGATFGSAEGYEGDDDCGVASGDPAEDAITLWSRVPATARARASASASALREPGRRSSLEVRWWIGVRRAGVVTVHSEGLVHTSAARDWTIKVRVQGLPQGGRFVYGFSLGDAWQSVEGRTRTLPGADADLPSLGFAYVSCQYYGSGFYNVYEALCGDDGVDFCVHLGDSIYENVSPRDKRLQVRSQPVGEAQTLEDYRACYLLALRDPWYREVRRRYPWIVLPDDHEVFNDYAGTDPAQAARRAAAFQAYFEFNALDDAPFPRIHRAFRFGRLTTLFALDERQHRDGAVCGGGALKTLCDAAKDPARTLLGVSQKDWLKEGIDASPTHWNVLLSEVMVMPQCLIDRPAGVERALHEDMLPHAPFFDSPSHAVAQRKQSGDSYLTLDSFDGFPAEREEIASFLTSKGQGNTLVWTGDVHNCYAGHLLDAGTRRAAFEMTTGSVTTFGVGDVLRWGSARLVEGHIRRSNRHYEFVDLRHHMYVRVTLTPESALHETICVDTVLTKDFRTFTGQSLNVAKGTLEVSRV